MLIRFLMYRGPMPASKPIATVLNSFMKVLTSAILSHLKLFGRIGKMRAPKINYPHRVSLTPDCDSVSLAANSTDNDMRILDSELKVTLRIRVEILAMITFKFHPYFSMNPSQIYYSAIILGEF